VQNGINKKKLALVRQDHIGDLLLWLPTVKYYRKYFSDYHIYLIADRSIATLSAILPYWDEFLPLNSNSFENTKDAKNFFDVIINTQFSRTYDSDLFIKSLKGREKISVESFSPNYPIDLQKIGNSFYTTLYPVDKNRKHELERNFEILNLCTKDNLVPTLASVKNLNIPDFSEKANLKKFIVIFPGSSWQKRSYPWPRFVDLIEEISKTYSEITITLCGGTEDKVIADNICKNTSKKIHNFCGKISLLDSFGIISKAELVISNDSMGAHAAVILNKKLVCLMGGGYTSKITGQGRFFPYPSYAIAECADQTILSHYLECYECENLCKYGNLVRDCIPCVDYIPKNDLIRAVLAQI
jgi:ADP-heptose:LPS heptosyltransferase